MEILVAEVGEICGLVDWRNRLQAAIETFKSILPLNRFIQKPNSEHALSLELAREGTIQDWSVRPRFEMPQSIEKFLQLHETLIFNANQIGNWPAFRLDQASDQFIESVMTDYLGNEFSIRLKQDGSVRQH